MRAPSRVTIRAHHPWRRALWGLALLAVVAAAAAWLLYERLGPGAGAPGAATGEARDLERELARLRARHQALQDRLVILEREAQVKAAAYRQVEDTLAAVQRERARLREEVAFYRGILAEGGEGELAIHSLTLRPGTAPGAYRYHLVLTRMGKSGKVSAGSVDLAVRGEGAAGEETLGLPALLPAGADRPRFRFKHFQRLEGTLRLPEGFTPRTLRVVVSAGDEAGGRVEQSYDWQGLLG